MRANFRIHINTLIHEDQTFAQRGILKPANTAESTVKQLSRHMEQRSLSLSLYLRLCFLKNSHPDWWDFSEHPKINKKCQSLNFPYRWVKGEMFPYKGQSNVAVYGVWILEFATSSLESHYLHACVLQCMCGNQENSQEFILCFLHEFQKSSSGLQD